MSDIFCYLCNSTVGGSWLCSSHKIAHQERVDAELALDRAKQESRRALEETREQREQPKSAIMAAFDAMNVEARKAAAAYSNEPRTPNEDIAWQIDGWVRGFEHMGDDDCKHLESGWCYIVAAGVDLFAQLASLVAKKAPKSRRLPTEVAARAELGALKIGSCRKATREALESRLRGIQGMCPVPLRIVRVIAGGERLERELHRRFAAYRMHGEWFSADVFTELPYGGCEECGFVVQPLDEKPEKYLAALRMAVDEAKKL